MMNEWRDLNPVDIVPGPGFEPGFRACYNPEPLWERCFTPKEISWVKPSFLKKAQGSRRPRGYPDYPIRAYFMSSTIATFSNIKSK